jgi:hypothetical protein
LSYRADLRLQKISDSFSRHFSGYSSICSRTERCRNNHKVASVMAGCLVSDGWVPGVQCMKSSRAGRDSNCHFPSSDLSVLHDGQSILFRVTGQDPALSHSARVPLEAPSKKQRHLGQLLASSESSKQCSRISICGSLHTLF